MAAPNLLVAPRAVRAGVARPLLSPNLPLRHVLRTAARRACSASGASRRIRSLGMTPVKPTNASSVSPERLPPSLPSSSMPRP